MIHRLFPIPFNWGGLKIPTVLQLTACPDTGLEGPSQRDAFVVELTQANLAKLSGGCPLDHNIYVRPSAPPI